MNMDDIRLELRKKFDDFRTGAEKNVSLQIKKAMEETDIFFKKAAKEALDRGVLEGEELDIKVISKMVMENSSKLIEIKHHSNPYLLFHEMQEIKNRLEEFNTRLNSIQVQIDSMSTGKYVDTSISVDELKTLYNTSNCTHLEMANFLNVETSHFYHILNGKEKNPDHIRRNKLKNYFLKKIAQRKGAINASS